MQKQVNVLLSGLMHYKIPLNIHRNDGSMHLFSILSLNIIEICQNQLFKNVVWDFQNARRSNSEICQSGVTVRHVCKDQGRGANTTAKHANVSVNREKLPV